MLYDLLCAERRLGEQPAIKEAASKDFNVTLEPLKQGEPYFNTFRITVQNNTATDMEIDWNKTQYIHDSRPNGRFVFTGIQPSDVREGTIPPDIVPGRATFQKEIAPFNLISYSPLREQPPASGQSRIGTGMFPQGENGALLVVRQGGKETRQEVSVRITRVEHGVHQEGVTGTQLWTVP